MSLKSFVLFLAAATGTAAVASKMNYATFARLYERLMSGATVAQLEDTIPRLRANLKIASKVSEAHWTESTPFDELAKAYILPEKVMDALGISHPITKEVMHVPAGLMHSYGYLFSQLKTAFGLKSKRWIESRLDERLGLEAGLFSPFTAKGEFLSNVTAAFLHYANAKPALAHAARVRPTARPAGALSERVKWKTEKGDEHEAIIHTRLIELKPLKGFETADVKLLIYEVEQGGKHRLVTGFPIDAKFAESIMATKPSSGTVGTVGTVGMGFKPRFNLYVDPRWTVVSYATDGFRPVPK